MRRLKRAGAMILAFFILLTAGAAAAGEGFIPPSPEPPDGNHGGRPTPAPTPIPETEVIDHIHFPRMIPDFWFQKDRKLLEIWFPNIKDADEAVLMYDGQVWMIDCGDDRAGARGATMLKQLGIEQIDVLFNTHPHHDHINGLSVTDDTARVKEVKICFPPESTDSGLRLLKVAEERQIPLSEFRDGDRFTMGDGAVELLMMKNDESNLDMNNQSACTMIRYGRRNILFLADMERYGQEAMYNRVGPEALKCDIVKYPHHAKSDMYDPFFKAMEAKMAVVTSVEGRGDAGQAALIKRGLPAAYTSVKGKYTHLVTDGEYWLCELVDSQEQ